LNVHVIFAWYDVWVGFFWDRQKHRLYVCPVPCIALVISFKESAAEQSR
jgi:hypothetical protein